MENFAIVPVVENSVANTNDEAKKTRQDKKAKKTPKRKTNDFNEVARQARVIYNKLERVGFLHWGIDGMNCKAVLKKKAVMQVLHNLRDEEYSRNNFMKDLRLRMSLLIGSYYFQEWLENYGLKDHAKAIAMNIAFEGTSKVESILFREVLDNGYIITEPEDDWLEPIFSDEEIAGQFKKNQFMYVPAFKALQELNPKEGLPAPADQAGND